MAKNAKFKKASEKTEEMKVAEEVQKVEADQEVEESELTEDNEVEAETEQVNTETEPVKDEVSTYKEPPVAKPVIPDNGYSRLMQFPAEVTLPMSVVVEVGAPNRRYQILSDGQEVPKAIIDWLKSDARYMRWFAQ